MKKIFFFAAIAALALSSCSSDEIVQTEQPVEDGAVVFSANTMRSTRALTHKASDITDELHLATVGGFGVFAYEQGKAPFSTFAASTSYPNFFYNQQVYDKTATATPSADVTALSEWVYAPIKYYSNNEGAKHSFFAYAPYMNNSKLSPVFSLGKAPQIRYNTLQNVDLLWATPTLDKEKAGVTEKINFNFKHALSKVTFHVAPFFNAVHGTHNFGTPLTDGTIITVKSIRFVGNVPSQALLDLETGKWTIENTQEGEYLVNVTPAKWDALNNSDPTGDLAITKYADLDHIKVIPADQVKIEIVYDVETTDGLNAQNSHKETNVVVSKEPFDLKSGMAYDFYLDLGMTSVKFDANFIDWSDAADKKVDLPNNHDFWAVPYAYLTTAPTAKTFVASTAMNTCETVGNFAYSNGVLYTCTTAAVTTPSAVNAVWADAADGNYIDETNKKVYVVNNAVCTVYDCYTTDGKTFYNTVSGTPTALSTTPLISLTPDSEGKVQKTDGQWVAPVKEDYYTVGSFLYQAKFFAPTTPSNRR